MKKRWLLFFVVGIVLFQCVSSIFVEKNSYAKYKNYKAQEDVDILILGTSHSDDGINARELETALENTSGRCEVFNYSIYGMRIEQLYYFMREVLKEKNPSIIIIDTFAFLPIADEHREILTRRAFDVFPLTQNKIEAISYLIENDKWSYYIPFIKYHSRWKELSVNDFKLLYDESSFENAGKTANRHKDVMEELDDYFETDTAVIQETQSINETEEECFEKILELAREKDIKILLVGVPFKEQLGMDSLQMIKVNNYLENVYVDDDNIRLLDMNRMWEELDFGYADLYNEGHCNRGGAKKVTSCLAEYLMNTYDISELGR